MPFIPEEGNKVKFKVLWREGGRAGRGGRAGLAVMPKTLKCAFYLRLEASVMKIPVCGMDNCKSGLWGDGAVIKPRLQTGLGLRVWVMRNLRSLWFRPRNITYGKLQLLTCGMWENTLVKISRNINNKNFKKQRSLKWQFSQEKKKKKKMNYFQ